MTEAKNGEPQSGRPISVVASALCVVAAMGLLAIAWWLGWWTPADGVGRMSAKLLVAGAVFLPVGLVALAAAIKRRSSRRR
ncbi:hypothetical protein GCM10010211_79480 [Streptomyces albospinus]|uniref:Integral membrane protein n=1 Tax=Streptomyces albospinus TaxID=285515 RepID=A0ABQ2VN11_9ACTN|nr:hypothetical protein [Streptomyces albospinus]GGV00248.1 hypothetical protein GCM10010211_79480 [Streptomyces albospinus]